ncbi:beta-ketoacyl synthase N-terminal-like domain-containing protein [Sorangium sp. So ce1097]|uniref:beta-ketoacyl synthase N-terminal-like domain-containing protein n=1 Tax=Sorangium sp. So ce1097 TaxID=3133330 RepID=UPI003F644A7D
MTAVTGLASVVLAPGAPCDPSPFLREKKSRKYLGLQDALAVVSAGRALAAAGLAASLPGERTGLYVAVGYIPFLERDIAPVLEGSLDERGGFSPARFGAEGYTRAHPLLAFRCLPNMPAYHVAANFGIEGPYAVLYPSAGQLYVALEEAALALERGEVDVALVVGVAHQRNYLVEHHMRRIDDAVPADRLFDASATVVLERADHAARRGAKVAGELASVAVAYAPFDPLAGAPAKRETVAVVGASACGTGGGGDAAAAGGAEGAELGPASPLVAVARAWEGGAVEVVHRLEGRDGIAAESRWIRRAS